jgi:hypothetical protein
MLPSPFDVRASVRASQRDITIPFLNKHVQRCKRCLLNQNTHSTVKVVLAEWETLPAVPVTVIV